MAARMACARALARATRIPATQFTSAPTRVPPKDVAALDQREAWGEAAILPHKQKPAVHGRRALAPVHIFKILGNGQKKNKKMKKNKCDPTPPDGF